MWKQYLVGLCVASILTSCAIVDRKNMGGMESLVTWKQIAEREAQVAPVACMRDYEQARDRVVALVNRIHTQIDIAKHEYFSRVDMSENVISTHATDAVADFFACAMGERLKRDEMFVSQTSRKQNRLVLSAAAIEAGRVVAEMVKEARQESRQAGAEVLHDRISVALWSKWDDLREGGP